MARGIKLCVSCNSPNGPRSKICKTCGYAFTFKPGANKEKLIITNAVYTSEDIGVIKAEDLVG